MSKVCVRQLRMALSEEESQVSEKDIQDIDGIESAVDAQFRKCYILPSYVAHVCNSHSNQAKNDRKESPYLPPCSRWFQITNGKWNDGELALMKHDLNSTKSLLNEKPLEDWHRHTRFRNPAADVIARVRSRGANPELLTQV